MGFVAGVVGGDANGSPVSMDGVGDCTGDATRSGRRIGESGGLCNDSGFPVRIEFDSDRRGDEGGREFDSGRRGLSDVPAIRAKRATYLVSLPMKQPGYSFITSAVNFR